MTSKPHIIVINGPNLNLLGEREPEKYGTQTLEKLNEELSEKARDLGLEISFFHSNHEGDLIDAIQRARNTTQGLIINPGGLTHTSVALRDALAAYKHPILEVHLSNIYTREAVRHVSFVSGVATAVSSGLGAQGYHSALGYLRNQLLPQ